MTQPEAGPSYKPAATLSAHSRSVTALRFSHDGRTLVSAGADGYVHFWDAASGTHERSLRAHRTGINDLTLSPDGLYLATAADDGSCRVFAMDAIVDAIAVPPITSGDPESSGQKHPPLRKLTGHTAPVLAVAFGPRGNLLVSGSFDESAIVWDVRRGKALRNIPAHAEAVWSVGWDAEGALVITGSADGLIRLWDVNTGQCLKTLDNESNSPVSSASFTPSSFFILSASLSSTVRIHSLHTGKVLKTFRAAEYVSEKHPCPTIVYGAPQGLALANGHTKDDAMDVDTEGVLSPPTAVASPTPINTNRAAWVIAGSENGKVVIWDLQDRRVIHTLEGHSSPIVALAITPDGRTIASGSIEPDRSIRLWSW